MFVESYEQKHHEQISVDNMNAPKSSRYPILDLSRLRDAWTTMPRQTKLNWRRTLLSVALVAFVTAICSPAQTPDQEPFLRIGSTDLRIGIPKEKVLTLLEADGFKRLGSDTPEQGSLHDKIEGISVLRYPDNELLRAVGQLYFENKRLIRVERLLEFKNESEAFATIYNLFAKFEREGSSICHLSARSIVNGDGVAKTSTIACGHKFIEIMTTENNAGKPLILGISEVLSDSVIP